MPSARREFLDDLTFRVNGAAMQVHQVLGPGLPELVYHDCLQIELKKRGFSVRRNVGIPIFYDGVKLTRRYKIDLLVNDELIVELKVAEEITRRHLAQILTYLRLAKLEGGLIYNFNVDNFREGGWRRVFNPDFLSVPGSRSSGESGPSGESGFTAP